MSNNTYNSGEKNSGRIQDVLAAGYNMQQKERVGFILPRFVVDELNRNTKPRKRSQFVSMAIAKALDEVNSAKKRQQLAESYQDTAEEMKGIAEDWNKIDLDDWDE